MENTRKYDISFLGEFVDKKLEREFLDYDMRRCARFIGPVALTFGVIYMLFIISDYFAIEDPPSFLVILSIRVLVLIVSAAMYLAVKRINDYANLPYLITAYEVFTIISFLVIIYQYKSLTFLSLFSVMAIILAVYITPNKLVHAQITSVFLILSFFFFSAKHIEGIETQVLLKIIAYNIILIIFASIGTYLTSFYKRKQFADSRELLRVSITDSLTGIFNRAKFGQELNQWVDYSNKYEKPLSLVIFDIDNFKSVNDNYGHLIGDGVLQSIAAVIKKAIRHTDVFARWGGEEFVILLPGTEIHQSMEMTERMRICISKIKYDKVENITCSFGLAELQENESAESLMQRADKHLYEAKDWGKNIVVCDSGSIGELNKTETNLFTLN